MEKSEINLNLLGTKAQTKNELYRLLTVKVKFYLPPQKETSIYFVRGIINRRKKVSIKLGSIFNLGFLHWLI